MSLFIACRIGLLFCFILFLAKIELLYSYPRSTTFRSLLQSINPSRKYYSSQVNFKSSLLKEWIDEQVQRSVIKSEDIKKIEIVYDDVKKRYSIKAMARIAKGETIISIPYNLCIDAVVAESRIGSSIKASSFRTGEFGLLALFILTEKLIPTKSKSKYRDYIDSFDQNPPGIFGWQTDLQLEFASSTTREIKRQIEAAEQDFEFVSNIQILSNYKDLLTKDLFYWALGSVKARAVDIDGKLILVPGIDAMDFDPFSTSEPVLSSSGIFGGKIVKVISERSYEPGENIVLSYGLKSSAECLEDHGIVPDLETDDSCCELTVALEGSERFYDDKVNVLENYGAPLKYRVDLEADPIVEIDNNLLRFLRLKLIEGTDAFILESVFLNVVYDILSLPFSRMNELKVMKYLKEDCCLSKLDRLNSVSNDERDYGIVDSKKDDSITTALARLRIQERAALRNTILKVDDELQTLTLSVNSDPREYYQERRLRELNLLRPLEEDEIISPD